MTFETYQEEVLRLFADVRGAWTRQSIAIELEFIGIPVDVIIDQPEETAK